MHDKIIRPHFFAENSITAQVYHVVSINYMIPQQKEYHSSATFHQDGVHHLIGTMKPSRFRAKRFKIGKLDVMVLSSRSPDHGLLVHPTVHC